jgi:hypothetical protein
MKWYDKVLLAFILISIPLVTYVYAAKWSTYTDATSGTIADADTFMFLDVTDTTLAATGTQKELSWANLKTDLNSAGFTLKGTAETISANWVNEANPWADAEVADDITLTNITQITTRKLDDLGTPDDNTDLNVSTSVHGLMVKLPNDATKVFDGVGSWVDIEDLADEIAAGIAEGELADSVVVSADIKDDTIDSADYAAASIDNEHLADDAVGVDEIATDAVTMDAIDADGAFTSLTGAWATTGVLSGAIGVTETTDGSETVSGAGAYGYLFEADHATATSDTTYTLPAAEVGMSACFYDNGAGTGGIILDPNSADNFILNGTAMANDENLNSPGVAGDGANGDYICIVAIDATTWVTMGRSGDWVEASP